MKSFCNIFTCKALNIKKKNFHNRIEFKMDASDCGVLCQHPGCWATRRRQEKGLARSLPPLKIDDDSSDDEISKSLCFHKNCIIRF